MIIKIIILSMLLIISGCLYQSSYNEDIAHNLPPKVALEYVRQLKSDSVNACVFNSTTMSANGSSEYPYSKFNVKSAYVFDVLLIFLDNKRSTHRCFIEAEESKKVKAVTALKALGVKTP